MYVCMWIIQHTAHSFQDMDICFFSFDPKFKGVGASVFLFTTEGSLRHRECAMAQLVSVSASNANSKVRSSNPAFPLF